MVLVLAFSLCGCGPKVSSKVKDVMSKYEDLCDNYCEMADKYTAGSIEIGDVTDILTQLSEVQNEVNDLLSGELTDEEKEYIQEKALAASERVQEAMKKFK